MHRSKLEAIAAKSAANLTALVAEHADLISEGIAAAAEEAENQGKESIVVNLSHTIRLDLGKDSQTDKLSWSVKHTVEACSQIPDPSQPELPMTGVAEAVREYVEKTKKACGKGLSSVTISSGGKSVTIDKDGVQPEKETTA